MAARVPARLDVGEVAHLPDVHADDRHAAPATRSTVRSIVPSPPRLTARSRSVGERRLVVTPCSLRPAMSASGCGHPHLVARAHQPRGGLAGQLGGLGALVVQHEPDGGHQAPPDLGERPVEQLASTWARAPPGPARGVQQELHVAVGAGER